MPLSSHPMLDDIPRTSNGSGVMGIGSAKVRVCCSVVRARS